MTQPVVVGDAVHGLFTGMRSEMADRAPLDPSRVGVQREPLPRWLRAAVIARDGAACTWCRNTRRPGLEMEIDHIVPWSAGGCDHPVNLRVLCALHNQARSNRVDPAIDLCALPIVTRCARCELAAAQPTPAVVAMCLHCHSTAATPYLTRFMLGGPIPAVGVPEPGVRAVGGGPLGSGLSTSAQLAIGALGDRAVAQTVTCPWCSALPGQPCRTSGAAPLTRSAAHPSRVSAATCG